MSLVGSTAYTRGANNPGTGTTPIWLKQKDTNGANNLSLTESSGSGVTYAIQGTTGNHGQTTFSPFCSPQGEWSLGLSAGPGDAISVFVPTNANLSVAAAQDFTWECYAQRSKEIGTNVLACTSTGATVISITAAGAVGGIVTYSGNAFLSATKAGQWFHVAIVRVSGTTSLYLNGTFIASNTTTNGAYDFSGASAFIGRSSTASTEWCGYISNLRITVGTGVYTRSFTPSRSPLTTLANTKLLAFCGPSLRDYSGNGATFTPSGLIKIVPANPFNAIPVNNYPAVGSFLSSATSYLNTAATFAPPSGDFTAEAWVYLVGATTGGVLFGAWSTTLGSSQWAVTQGNPAGSVSQLRFIGSHNGTTLVDQQSSSSPIQLNTWMHLAVSRQGSTIRLFVNGAQVLSITPTLTFTANAAYNLMAASQGTGPNVGYISNYRYTNGTAVYTAAFTPPTAPVAAVSGTSVLMNFGNSSFYDASNMLGFTGLNNTAVSTAQAPTGYTSSMVFTSGTTDKIRGYYPRHVIELGGGDFTAEFYVYFQTANGTMVHLLDTRGNSSNPNFLSWSIARSAANKVVFYYSDNSIRLTGNANLVQNTWYHVAVTRSNGQLRIYVDGQLDASVADTAIYPVATDGSSTNSAHNLAIHIGSNYADTARLTGYMRGVRLSKWSRYGDTFTPPTDL